MRIGARPPLESVDSVLDGLAVEGWDALRGLSTPHGVVDCLVTGPGGAYAVEVRAQPGCGRVAGVPQAWLRQAAAQADAAERWLGAEVTPLLVLRFAELDEPGACREGVTVLGVRDLASHLRVGARRTRRPTPAGVA